MKSWKRAGKAGLVLSFAAVVVFFGTRRAPERLLARMSKAICTVSEVHNGQEISRDQWLAADSILEITRPFRKLPGGFAAININDHSRKSIPGLYERVHATGALPAYLSPNKEWLLCRKYTKDKLAYNLYAVGVRNSQLVEWPRTRLPPNMQRIGEMWVWASDSSSFVILFERAAFFYHIGPPAVLTRVTFR